MTKRRRRRKKNSGLRDTVSIITSIALLVIAVLMVIFVVFYIKNNSFLGSVLGGHRQTAAETSESTEDTEADIDMYLDEEGYGLIRLANGDIMYAMDAAEAAEYDEEHVLKVPAEVTRELSKATGDAEGSRAASDIKDDTASARSDYRYYLADSWLDLDSNLYHFDEEGHACTDTFKEGAFIYSYDSDGILKRIVYNKNYTESADTAHKDFPGLVQTKTLWAYMNSSKKIGSYTAVMYKKTTDSLSHLLGTETSPQYASPYAYAIAGNKIYYLAVSENAAEQGQAGTRGTANNNSSESAASYGSSSASSQTGVSGSDTVLKSIVGKLFCMSPGADYREIAAENAEGFKVVTDKSGGMPVVYYYDGSQIRRSVTLKKDENMTVFSEDTSYSVDISEGYKAYLTVENGPRVSLQQGSFKAGNFTYSLAADGEILTVAEKTTVSTGGYTYSVENGESFGARAARVVRKDKSGKEEIISGEFEGTAANLHYDYDSSSIIAEYTDGHGNGGLLKISLSGDVDMIEDSEESGGKVVLYAIDNGRAIYKTTENDKTVFKTARIAASTPLTVGIDPVTTNISDAPVDDTAEGSGDAHTGNGSGSSAVETVSAPDNSQSTGGHDTAVGHAPGDDSDVAAHGRTSGGV